jgi:hypothetical protein
VDLPTVLKDDSKRSTHTSIVLPVHEQVSKAYVDEDRTPLHEVLEARDLPPCYYNHRVVRENPNEEVAFCIVHGRRALLPIGQRSGGVAGVRRDEETFSGS